MLVAERGTPAVPQSQVGISEPAERRQGTFHQQEAVRAQREGKMNMDLMPQNLLDRDEDDILPYEDVKWQDSDLSAEERIFLEEFPNLKEELEVGIRKLHALADHVSTTHRTLTKTSMVANSIAVVSGAMSILGLVLAPAVAGGSLVLFAAGTVLGKAGEVTTILTNVLEHFHSQEAQAYVGSLMPTRGQEVMRAGAVYVMAAGKVVQNCESTIKDIQRSIRAFQIVRAHPRLATAAKSLLTTGQVSARRSRQVQRAFEGTTLVMKTNARLLGTAMAGFSLSVGLASLLKDWKQLKEGAKSELAEELRAQVWELERKLTEFTQCYESLQQKKLSQEKKPVSSSSEGTMGTVPLPPARRGKAGSQGTGEDEGN
ncbi:apolipoprotein L6-like [Mesoplodon densirostris]|uniref:apolipoprotein L6-like n=1 Tax=Mesoplodon densirostris TaxID=48708 RepID=UPI0028DD158F|nr:apolipoprotein L6-like [Mesoplodon densirostris]